MSAIAKNAFGSGFEGNSGIEHLEKRQREGHYTNLTFAQYEAMAYELLQQDIGGSIEGYETSNGKVVRWDKESNDYATGFREKCIKTLFPLRGGQQRFEKLREYDERGE